MTMPTPVGYLIVADDDGDVAFPVVPSSRRARFSSTALIGLAVLIAVSASNSDREATMTRPPITTTPITPATKVTVPTTTTTANNNNDNNDNNDNNNDNNTAATFPPVQSTVAVPETSSAPSSTFELMAAVAPSGTVTHGSLLFDGIERSYRLYLPSTPPSSPVPLFIGLHGGTGWGDQFAQTNDVEGLAESNGFIVVHPDGVQQNARRGGVWNGGVCCGVAARDEVDDVGFINELIDLLEADHPIDPGRVYAFGHSNGAIMSYRLACESADRIVGIGLYAGTLGVEPCDLTQPVSIMHVHGTADTNLPLAGGVGADSIAGVDFPPPREGFATIAALDECPAPSASTVGDITIERSEPCSGSAAAEFVTIDSANHAWPGGTPRLSPTSEAGYSGYDTTAEIVAFLLAHPRP